MTQRGKMELYGDIISPYVRICLVTAQEAGLGDQVALVHADVKVATVNAKLENLSPIAQIPVLKTADGHVLHDSRVIVDYLCHAGSAGFLIPSGGTRRFQVLTLQAIAQGMTDAAVAYRNEVAQRPPALHWHDGLSRLRRRVEATLQALETSWAPELGELSVGSLSVAVALCYLDYRLADWTWRAGRDRLAAFHERFCARTSMTSTALPAA